MKPETPRIGERIHVIGNSGAGKSTLAARLAELLQLPLVELDALNWQPGWVGLNQADPVEFERLIREATAGDRWIVAGSYSAFCRRTFWDRVETMIWLDLPMWQMIARVVRRSWRRWRSQELLWGTNRERIWQLLMVWDKDQSMVAWILTQHRRKRREMLEMQADPAWSRIHFIRLSTSSQVDAFEAALAKQDASQRAIAG